MSVEATAPARSADQLVGRLFEAILGANDLATVYLGDRLGFYAALNEHGPLTSAELAARAGTDERYTREWLEQQAATGILEADLSADPPRFSLPSEYAEVFCDLDSLASFAPFVRIYLSGMFQLPAVLEAFRTGSGVPWEDYGADAREGQANANRPMFLNQLVQDYLPQIPGLVERLSRPGARVAEVGGGEGWASIAVALGFAEARVDGFDPDAAAVEAATRNAADRGVSDRVRFHAIDAAKAEGAGQYDLVMAYECIHDMSDPVAVLRAMRRLVARGGTVMVMDEKVSDRFAGPADELDRFFYGFSIMMCLPNGRTETPSAATGTVLRSPTLRRYAQEAGFADIEVLPIENDFFRFYRLVG